MVHSTLCILNKQPDNVLSEMGECPFDQGGYFIKTNSQGFRSDKEFSKKKSGRRILFFGDSNTAADGVCNQDRYSDLIGKYFKAEVFNFAISGTGTDQQYLTWEKYAKEVEADLIVIGVLVENIERNKVCLLYTSPSPRDS